MPQINFREELFGNFLNNCQITNYEIKKIAGDASFRSYYRIFQEGKENLILMDAPPEYEDIKPFVNIDEILRENGFLAPEIIAKDYENGLLLLQDFGDISVNKELHNLSGQDLAKRELEIYQQSCDILIDLHKIKIKQDSLPVYDANLLEKEVLLFIDWYLPHIAKKDITEEEKELFLELFHKLFAQISDDKILVLRDYHADNLMIYNKKIALLDFQDAVIGSKAYDLVSLLEDARRGVDEEIVKNIKDYYLQNSDCNKKQFLTDYQILSLQRNIKIIGIFSRLAIRDGKKEYLNLLPRMFNYVKLRLLDDIFIDIRQLLNKFI